jgi:hypothetical protein
MGHGLVSPCVVRLIWKIHPTMRQGISSHFFLKMWDSSGDSSDLKSSSQNVTERIAGAAQSSVSALDKIFEETSDKRCVFVI